MKFRPLHDRILVKRLDQEAKSKGGIIIPDTAQEKPMEGRVIAVGDGTGDQRCGGSERRVEGRVMAVGSGKVKEEGVVAPLDVKKGDRILFSKYSGAEIKL